MHLHRLVDFRYLREEWDLLCSLEENYSLEIKITPESSLFNVWFVNLFDGSVTSAQCSDIRILKITSPKIT